MLKLSHFGNCIEHWLSERFELYHLLRTREVLETVQDAHTHSSPHALQGWETSTNMIAVVGFFVLRSLNDLVHSPMLQDFDQSYMIIKRSSTDHSNTFIVPKMECTNDRRALIKRTIFTIRTTRMTLVKRRIRMIRTFPDVLKVSESASWPMLDKYETRFRTEVILIKTSR